MTSASSASLRTAPRDHTDTRARPYALIALEVLLAIGAAGGAFGLATGAMPLGDIEARLPWQSPVLGGAALALVVALPAAVVAVAAWQRRDWSEWGHVVVGAALMGWIVVQVAIIGATSALQPIMFVWGAVILGLALARRPWNEEASS
jgi:hypothetical protein